MFELAGIDRTLIRPEFVSIELVRKPFPVNGFPIDQANGNLIGELSKTKTQQESDALVSKFDNSTPLLLQLQFPPRITSDTKSADWQEESIASYEPLAIFLGSSARKITIDLTYIVGAGTDREVTFRKNGSTTTKTASEFCASTVGLLCNQIKAYFYRSIQGLDIPVVRIRFYNHIGAESGPAVFRLMDVNITHGETIIKDETGVFPLLTKVTLNAALTTRIGDKVQSKNLTSFPFRDWY